MKKQAGNEKIAAAKPGANPGITAAGSSPEPIFLTAPAVFLGKIKEIVMNPANP